MNPAGIQHGGYATAPIAPFGGPVAFFQLFGVGALGRVIVCLSAARLTFNVFRYVLVVFIQQAAIILTVISEH